MSKRKRKRPIHPLIRSFAKVARERYGDQVKLTLNQRSPADIIRIKWLTPDRTTITDYFVVTQEAGTDPSPYYLRYFREVALEWEPGDTPESTLDDVEEIRCSTVRAYWKEHYKPE